MKILRGPGMWVLALGRFCIGVYWAEGFTFAVSLAEPGAWWRCRPGSSFAFTRGTPR